MTNALTCSQKERNNIELPGYQAQLRDDAVLHSQRKLERATENLKPFIECPITSVPCSTEAETLGYRCKCSFQMIQNENTKIFQYAMRKNGEPIALGSSTFPIANRRIQLAMKNLLENVLNSIDKSTGEPMFPNLSQHSLSSTTFAASWNDTDTPHDNQDCIVTLNYNAAMEDEAAWLEEARRVCEILKLTNLHGRSKNVLCSVVPDQPGTPLGSYLGDTVYLFAPSVEDAQWQVALQMQDEKRKSSEVIPVIYQKPEVAFFHPNARVMCQALSWMLGRLTSIRIQNSSKCRLLELYCGCGAHTLALAKSGLCACIQAVELDQRLVDACKVNIAANSRDDTNMTTVEIIRGDAGRWARQYHKKKANEGCLNHSGFNVLLVDPPRQGLDANVIDLAIQVDSIQHILIISCGHEALVRDLKLLCREFQVINCHQLDLFPRTDSVEALVHLQRRSFSAGTG